MMNKQWSEYLSKTILLKRVHTPKKSAKRNFRAAHDRKFSSSSRGAEKRVQRPRRWHWWQDAGWSTSASDRIRFFAPPSNTVSGGSGS